MKVSFMKFALVLIFFVGTTFSWALAAQTGTVRLDLKLEANNHLITQPSITVPLGKKSVTEKIMADDATYIIEVTPQKDIDEQVYLDFTLRKIYHGKTFLISHPRMITLNNQLAVVEEGDSATSDVKNIVLSVTPHL